MYVCVRVCACEWPVTNYLTVVRAKESKRVRGGGGRRHYELLLLQLNGQAAVLTLRADYTRRPVQSDIL